MSISVAMCTYNGERHVREQLDSIAAQSRPPDELVICDDGSTDGTRVIVSNFGAAATFPVRVHVNEQNLGSTKNFERAIGLCTGEVIALSDQDDLWLPEKLAVLEAAFDRNPDVGLVFTDAEVVDENTCPTGRTLWETLQIPPADLESLRSRRTIDVLLQGSTVTGATTAFRGRFKELVVPIPNDLPVTHDAWIAVLVGAASEVLPLAQPLIRYRQHVDQQIGPRPRVRIRSGRVRDALRRTSTDPHLLDVSVQVQQRLSERGGAYNSDYASSRLASRLTHMQTRVVLPEHALPRLTRVARELFSGRYHAFSRGFLSAAKDLLHPPRPR
ncbi:MAG TPA: glycosyltransferase family 2 protein [Thermoleophilaceae bacterium]